LFHIEENFEGADSLCIWCWGGGVDKSYVCSKLYYLWGRFGVKSIVHLVCHRFLLVSDCCIFYLSIFLYLGRKGRKEEMMIWHAVVWVLWRARNDKIFSGWRASNLSHGCGFWLKWVVLHFFTMNGVLTQLIFSLDSSFLWVITIPVPTLISTYICG
jgi:hypothetical protein